MHNMWRGIAIAGIWIGCGIGCIAAAIAGSGPAAMVLAGCAAMATLFVVVDS